MRPWWPGAHQFHCLKVLLHFNYLKVGGLARSCRELRKCCTPSGRRHYFFAVSAVKEWGKGGRELGKQLQQRNGGNKNGRIWFSLDLSHTEELGFLFLFSFPSLLFRRSLLRQCSQGQDPSGKKKEPYFSPLLVSPMLLWRNEIHIKTFKQNSTF